jgi:GGDEF domain-containing protein
MGLALYPEDGSSRDSLLNAADAGMYRAKHVQRQAIQDVGEESNLALSRLP